jgi:polar amino acid transport system substrate-binding protein
MKLLLHLLILQIIVFSPSLMAQENSIMLFNHCNKYPKEDQGVRVFMRDVAQEFGRRLSVSVNHFSAPIKRCLGMLMTGEADFMLYANPADDRVDFMDFLHPSDVSDVVFMVRKEDGDWVHSLLDLQDKKLGLVNGYRYFPELHADTSINKESVVNPTQLPKMLMAQHIDAFVTFEGIANRSMFDYPNIMIASYRVSHFLTSFIVISKASPLHQRLGEVERVIVAMIDDGFVETTLEQYIPGMKSPFSKNPNLK